MGFKKFTDECLKAISESCNISCDLLNQKSYKHIAVSYSRLEFLASQKINREFKQITMTERNQNLINWFEMTGVFKNDC